MIEQDTGATQPTDDEYAVANVVTTSCRLERVHPRYYLRYVACLTVGLSFICLGLQGCSRGTQPVLPLIVAGPNFGQKPTLAFAKGIPPKDLQVEVISPGSGTPVKRGDTVEVNFLGQVWGERKPFDDSFDQDQPVRFVVGAGQVVEAWDRGLIGERTGSRIEMSVPPSLGFGADGSSSVQPEATVIYVIDILANSPGY
ncbi:FKBP-type peptidyl-prolyl cis-trans isomerase [Streptomyces sp. NPDC059985]|uniref:FKBP-type peptidyl-prolyl cis-trans isomerase n=1 Tax=Streptomyces sp. NPDC059985 TaxID=3347025 RepID=UPI00367F5AB4